MNNFSVLILSFFLFACSVSSDKSESKENESKLNFVKTFEGKIDNLSIIVKIECISNIIKGNYYYLGNAGEMELQGEFTTKSSFNIEEFNLKGSKTGSFKGELKDGKLQGTWSNAKGDKSYSFYLIESNTKYSPSKESINISGEYASGTNTLKISKINKQSFVAEFCIGSLNCEMGCYIGEFVLTKDGYYKGSLPELNPNKYVNITINSNKLIVESNFEIGMDIGARCGLDGNYSN